MEGPARGGVIRQAYSPGNGFEKTACLFQIVVYCMDQGVIEDATIDAAEIGLGRWPIQ